MTPGLDVHDLTVRLHPAGPPLVSGVSLTVPRGQAVGICGRSGSGKSTVLAAICGLLPWARPGRVTGCVALDGEDVSELDPAQRAAHLATCLDRPEAQLFLATPSQEVAAARLRHAPAPLADALVDVLGVGPLLERRTVELSSGERQRVALATTLAAAPKVVVLDEPCTHLDEDGTARLAEAIRLVTGHGSAVLVTEQAPWRLAGAVPTWYRLAAGSLAPTAPPTPPRLPAPPPPRGGPVLEVASLAVDRGALPIVRSAHLEIRGGEVVMLSGRNGAGKSSLARALAGHAASAGIAVRRSTRWLRRPEAVALALPDAELQLFEATVAREVASTGAPPAIVGERLRRHRLEGLAARAPWTLSRGERQRLLHATLDALEAPLTIVDEPGQGLDPQDVEELASLVRERAADGHAYLLLTHRREFGSLAHRHLVLEGGRLEPAGGGA